MKQTLVIKLAPTEEQYDSLLQTMERFNEACNFVAGIAFGLKTANKIRLQKVAYQDVRRFGLSAQMAIRTISKVSEAYKRDRSIKPTFKPHSAMVYDQRILSWKGLDRVSILTLKGRQIIPIRIGAYQEARLDRKVRQCDLILRNGTFYLALTLDAPEPSPDDPTGALGVDLGIVHLAVDSDGEFYSGEQVDKIRQKTDRLKASLQSKGTKSAKRHLKKLSGREASFRRNTNHVISKKLVAKAKDTHCLIALEDLNGIRQRVSVRHGQRRRHHSWAFYQLRQFISYKARLAGVLVRLVDPKHTSQTCPRCGFVSKSNRQSQSSFVCKLCDFRLNADLVGAINIAQRATVNLPIVSPSPLGMRVGTSPLL